MYRFSIPTHHKHQSLLLLALIMPGTSALAQCEGLTTTIEIQARLAEAESALAALDAQAFRSHVDGTGLLLPCLGEPISPRLAANLHRLVGIRAFGGRDPLAERAFAAARHIEPNYQFSLSLIPDGNPVRDAYEQVALDKRSTLPIDPPSSGQILVDGSASDQRPLSWPAVVQWVDDDQTVQFSDYFLPGQSLPDYPRWEPQQERGKAPVGLLATSVGLGVVSAGLYGVALAEQARYKDTVNDPLPTDQLDGLRRSTNGLVLASALGATAALGTGVAVVVAW